MNKLNILKRMKIANEIMILENLVGYLIILRIRLFLVSTSRRSITVYILVVNIIIEIVTSISGFIETMIEVASPFNLFNK